MVFVRRGYIRGILRFREFNIDLAEIPKDWIVEARVTNDYREFVFSIVRLDKILMNID
jgi:hypothetical protein